MRRTATRAPARSPRARRVIAVEGTAGRREDHRRAAGAGGLADIQRPEDVRGAVAHGILDRDRHARLRGEMTDEIGAAAEGALERIPLGDVQLLEAGPLGHVLARPGGEVVDDEDVVAALQEDLRDVRSNEAGAPGDGNAQAAQATSTAGARRVCSMTSARMRSRSSDGRHPMASLIFSIAGSRCSTSSIPSPYTSACGTNVSFDSEPVRSSTRCARSRMRTRSDEPMLKMSPDNSRASISATMPRTVSDT